MCACSLETKIKYVSKKLDVKLLTDPVTSAHSYINNVDGFIMVEVTPPTDLYHPLLHVFTLSKQNAFIHKVFASPMLKVAIEDGNIVTKIYRADRYKIQQS